MEISDEAVKLFARGLSIQGDYQNLDHPIFLLQNGYIGAADYERLMMAAFDNPEPIHQWSRDPEYIEVRAALGAELDLGPEEINLLDELYGKSWASDDDPGIAIWKRALDLRRRLHEAHIERIVPNLYARE